jgi:RHS repeat-associated protein
MRYDARRELVATSTVDGAERSRYFGRPDDLTRPASVTPSPWLRTGYDANDNAGRTHPQQASGYSDHWNTPVVTEVDALGRTVRRSEESRSDGSAPIAQHLRYDLRGNLVAVEDAQGRTLQRTDFDLLNRAWVTESVDSGRHVTLRNAAGDPVENVTPTGGRILFGYDRLRRLIGQWASDEAGDPVTLRFRSLYGDEGGAFLSEREARAGNLLGRKAFHFDEGGLTRTERYSFAGDLLEQVRIPLQRAELLALLSEDGGRHRPIDWSPPPGSLAEEEPALLGKRLAAEERRFSAGFDALGRMIEQRFPASDGNARPQVTVYYNEAGLLTALAVDGTPYITEIAYDAGGNRIAVLWGNGLLTRYCYDPATRLLARLRSERCKVTAEDSWLPLGDPVQDQRFYHDLSGNHVAVEEQVRGCGIIGAPDGADRLLQRMAATAPWDAAPRSNDPTATRLYVERYRYDEDGMLVELRHVAEGGNFTRSMVAAPGSHRLASLRAGEIRVDIQSDVAGQVTGEGLDRHFAWDAQGRLAHFRVQSGDAPPSLAVRYLYNETGERVAKLFFRQGRGVELTHYVAPGYEVVERLDDAASPTATLTVLEGSRRLASLRFGPPLPGDSLPAVCFTLADHLGSAALTLDANGELLVREEYTPFGETSFGSYARKRYRFGSHERDGESGLYYQGLRYYAPWVARWISADPAGMVDGVHLYRYVRNNPLKLVDPSGLGGEKPKGAIDSWPPMCRVDEDSRPKANPPPETEKQQQTQNPGPIDGVEMMRIANQPTIGAASPYLTSYNPVNVQYKLITSNIDAVRSSGMAGMAALVILATAPDMDPVKANGIIKLAGLAEGTLMQGAGDYARSRKGYEGIDNLGDPTQLPNIKYAYQGTKGTAVSVPNGTKATASIMASKTLSPAKSVTSLPHAVNVSGSIATANGAVRKLPAEARVDAYRGYMQETMALHPDFVVAEIPVTGDTSGRIFARSNGTTTVITGAGQMYHGDLADTRQFTPTFTANGIFTGYQPNYSALKFVK